MAFRLHTVVAGDTLSELAERFGTTVGELVHLNHLADPNLIRVGQVLRVPDLVGAGHGGGHGGGGHGDGGHGDGGHGDGGHGGGGHGGGGPGDRILTTAELRAIMPTLSLTKAMANLPLLAAAMTEGSITTAARMAAFLAQIAHESGELKFFEELASGEEYEGRLDLGNTHPGDGRRFKGRGPIQLTGRFNYTAASAALGVDLVANPALASTPQFGFLTAQWFWTTHGLNPLADRGQFDDITRRVNGGLRGKASRDRYYARAKAILGP